MDPPHKQVLGRPVEMSDVEIESLYPPNLDKLPWKEFEQRVCQYYPPSLSLSLTH